MLIALLVRIKLSGSIDSIVAIATIAAITAHASISAVAAIASVTAVGGAHSTIASVHCIYYYELWCLVKNKSMTTISIIN